MGSAGPNTDMSRWGQDPRWWVLLVAGAKADESNRSRSQG